MKKVILNIFITFGIMALFGYFIFRNLPTIKETYQITAQNLTGSLLLAIVFMFLAQWCVGKLFQKSLAITGIKRNAKEMLSLALQSLAINIVVPTAGFSMALLYAGDAQKRGESRSAAANGVFLAFMADYTAISAVLLVMLFLLFIVNSLIPSVTIPTIIFFFLTGGIYLISFLSTKNPALLEKTLIVFSNIFITPFLKLFRKKSAIIQNIKKAIRELSGASKSISNDPKDMISAMGWAFASHLMRIMILYFVFVSLGFPAAYQAILAGYAVGSLLIVIAPTPNGVGFVEGSMALVMSSLGVPPAIATTATLIYRAFEFWIPFGFGFFLLQRSRISEIQKETQVN